MSIEKCLENENLGGKLGVVGFMSPYGCLAYRRFSGVDFFDVAEDAIPVMISNEITAETRAQLETELNTTITTLKCRNPWVNLLAIATPALDIDVSIPDLQIISPVEAIVQHCLNSEVKCVGLLGTEWDTASDGPLAKALNQCKIQPWEPQERERRHALSQCVISALREPVLYKGQKVDAVKFCLDTVSQMLYETVGLMETLILCNPELRQLRPPLNDMFARKRKFATMPKILDVTDIYWPRIIEVVSQLQENPSGSH